MSIATPDMTEFATLCEQCSPAVSLAQKLDTLAALELAHSDRVVACFGQRAYDVVRECRSVASLAARTSAELGEHGPRQPRRSDS